MSAFTSAMDTTTANRVLGENGAPALASSGNALVDLFVKSVRDLDDSALERLFAAARAEAGHDPTALADLIVLAFQTRCCRGGAGKGEKALSYKMIHLLVDALGAETVEPLLPLVPEMGYWKDILQLIALKPTGPIAERCLELYAEVLKSDEAELAAATAEKRVPKLTLAAKWAPREGGSFDKKAQLASKLALKLHGTSANKPAAQRRYRKLVASLNASLNVPEVLMASNRWAEIRFASVASRCLSVHRKAFLNESLKGKMTPALEATGNRFPDDADRVAARANLREAMVSKGVKGKQLGPHELAAKLMGGRRFSLSTAESDLMQAQWVSMRQGVVEQLAKAAAERDAAVLAAAAPSVAAEGGPLASVAALTAALPKSVDLGKLVPLVDVSGSMGGQPMEVAIGLGILVSELAAADFRDRVLTFESSPSWVDLSDCANIAAKVAKVQSAGWGGSTDFAAACERILAVAQSAKLSPDDVPDLIVFSDMQFDCARGAGFYSYGYGYGGSRAGSDPWETQYERLERRFADVGRAVCGQPYAPPRIIFWNLRGNTVGAPVQADAPNTQMLSGFSPALLKLVLTGAELDVIDEEEVVQPDGTVKVKRSGPTPEQTLRAALDDSAYDAVRRKLSALSSGPLAGYSFETAEEADGFEVVELE